jgi:hypothetical protein
VQSDLIKHSSRYLFISVRVGFRLDLTPHDYKENRNSADDVKDCHARDFTLKKQLTTAKMFNKQLREDVATIKEQLDFNHYEFSFWSGRRMLYQERTLKEVINSIKSRLDQQEKMQKMLFTHLGIEYAKITEETKAGKQEKEVLRKIKKQKN